MKASEFIDFASQLAAATDASAPSLRSSSSRAYYGAFHVAKQFLHSLDAAFSCRSGGNDHQFVQQHLMYCEVPDVADLGRLLSNLHESRKDADYRLEIMECESANYAQLCVDRASKIRDDLAKVAMIPAMKANVIAGINKYRKKFNIT